MRKARMLSILMGIGLAACSTVPPTTYTTLPYKAVAGDTSLHRPYANSDDRVRPTFDLVLNQCADANPATAHMFIINPPHGGLSGLFASHPSTEERIARLRAMAGETAVPARGPWS